MSSDAQRDGESAMDIEVTKTSAQAIRPMQFGLYSAPAVDNCQAWPRDPWAMATLMLLSAEHARACHIKAHGVAGQGVSGKGAAQLAALVPDGDLIGFLTQLQLHIEGFANAFVQKIWAGAGAAKRIVGLRLLPPATMFRSGPRKFVQIAYLPDGTEKVTRFNADDIHHLREIDALGMAYAIPSWYAADGMAQLVDSALQYNRSYFDNSAVPDTAVIFEGFTPDKDSKEEVRNYFRREFKGVDNAKRTMILAMPDGAKIHFEKLGDRPKDGDFLKLLDAMRDRIVLAHGVPPRMMGIMSAGQLGGGSEVTGQLFVFEKLTLNPRRMRLLSQLNPLLKAAGIAANSIELADMDVTPPDVADATPADVQKSADQATSAAAALAAMLADG